MLFGEIVVAQYDTVNYEVADSIATVTLNRPDRLNTFNVQMRRDLLGAMRKASLDEEVRAIILTSEGRAFCAGADLFDKPPEDQLVEDRINAEYKPILMAIHNAPKPVIAAVRGAAAGIGSALALVCDLVVMDDSAYIYQAFAAIGLIPDGGASWLLSHRLGRHVAFEIMMTGERIDAERCVQLGLANKSCAPEALMDEARALAAVLASKAPLAVRYTKQAVRGGATLSYSEAVSLEASLQGITVASEDHQEGRKAFSEKRKPVWRGK